MRTGTDRPRKRPEHVPYGSEPGRNWRCVCVCVCVCVLTKTTAPAPMRSFTGFPKTGISRRGRPDCHSIRARCAHLPGFQKRASRDGVDYTTPRSGPEAANWLNFAKKTYALAGTEAGRVFFVHLAAGSIILAFEPGRRRRLDTGN